MRLDPLAGRPRIAFAACAKPQATNCLRSSGFLPLHWVSVKRQEAPELVRVCQIQLPGPRSHPGEAFAADRFGAARSSRKRCVTRLPFREGYVGVAGGFENTGHKSPEISAFKRARFTHARR